MIARVLAVMLASGLIAPLSAASEDAPGAYARRVTVTPAAGSALQRVDLPASVLVAARSPTLADVRMFDASGRAVPIALSNTPDPQPRQNLALAVLPILGPAEALAASGVSLRIDDRQRATIVRVDGSRAQTSGESRLLGVLLDTRRITNPVAALSLGVSIPAGQPVTFTVQSSGDLSDWEPLAQKVLYRTEDSPGVVTIPLREQLLKDRYVRVTWQASSRLLSPVEVRSATAVTVRNGGGAQAPSVVLRLPTTPDRHAIEFTLPFPGAISALEITPEKAGTIVPVRILGRNTSEEPWTQIASGSLFRVTDHGRARTNAPFDLQGARFRDLRIEADERSAGFTSAPSVVARLEPMRIAFLATGTPPYTLAVGRDDAAPAFLPLRDLLEAGGASAETALATARTLAEPVPIVSVTAVDQGAPWRKIALWGVLLAGTALLGAMVWLLMRRREDAG